MPLRIEQSLPNRTRLDAHLSHSQSGVGWIEWVWIGWFKFRKESYIFWCIFRRYYIKIKAKRGKPLVLVVDSPCRGEAAKLKVSIGKFRLESFDWKVLTWSVSFCFQNGTSNVDRASLCNLFINAGRFKFRFEKHLSEILFFPKYYFHYGEKKDSY